MTVSSATVNPQNVNQLNQNNQKSKAEWVKTALKVTLAAITVIAAYVLTIAVTILALSHAETQVSSAAAKTFVTAQSNATATATFLVLKNPIDLFNRVYGHLDGKVVKQTESKIENEKSQQTTVTVSTTADSNLKAHRRLKIRVGGQK